MLARFEQHIGVQFPRRYDFARRDRVFIDRILAVRCSGSVLQCLIILAFRQQDPRCYGVYVHLDLFAEIGVR